MNATLHLAEQHILAFESHLKHIDETMAKALQARVSATPEVRSEIDRLSGDRDKLAQSLGSYRSRVSNDASTAAQETEGLKGVFQSVGLQLEKILAAVVDPEHKSH